MKLPDAAILVAGAALEVWNIRTYNKKLRETVAEKASQNGAPIRLPFKSLR